MSAGSRFYTELNGPLLCTWGFSCALSKTHCSVIVVSVFDNTLTQAVCMLNAQHAFVLLTCMKCDTNVI